MFLVELNIHALCYSSCAACNMHETATQVTLTHVIIVLNKNTEGAKKGEANQKQQLSDFGYIAILVTKSFDIKLRPRIS